MHSSSRTRPASEQAITGHGEQETRGVQAKPADIHVPGNYFQSLFGTPDANLYGWSPPNTYPSGTELFRQNDPATQIYFIEKGIVKLTCAGPGGQEVIICLRRKNWLLGVTQVLADNVYSASATTLTRCAMRCISAKAFASQLTTDIALSVELNRMLSREIRGNLERIVALGCMSAAERLRRFLSELISEEDLDELLKKGSLELPIKSAELAEIVAVTPQHLYRLLKGPGLRTYLKQDKGILTIVDPSAFMLEGSVDST